MVEVRNGVFGVAVGVSTAFGNDRLGLLSNEQFAVLGVATILSLIFAYILEWMTRDTSDPLADVYWDPSFITSMIGLGTSVFMVLSHISGIDTPLVTIIEVTILSTAGDITNVFIASAIYFVFYIGFYTMLFGITEIVSTVFSDRRELVS